MICNFSLLQGVGMVNATLLALAMIVGDGNGYALPNQPTMYEQCMINLDEDKYDEMIEQGSLVIQKNERYGMAFAVRALGYAGKCEHAKSAIDLQKALKLDSRDYKLLSICALSCAYSGDYEKGLKLANDAMKTNSRKPDGYLARGYVNFAIGKTNDAIKDIDIAVKINPNSARAHYLLGSLLYRLGDEKGMQENFNRAIKLNPNYVQALAVRGLDRVSKGETDKGRLDLENAIKANEKAYIGYAYRGLARTMEVKTSPNLSTQKKRRFLWKRSVIVIRPS